MDSTEEELSTFTTKGRRTKRQRSSSTYRDCGGVGGGSDNSYHGSSTSASPSDEHDVMSEVTTEEEDMANCLILLAQGIQNKGPNNNVTKRPNNNNSIGVYECKTCNKTFPSFQALGGHRTSHKKIKPLSSTTVPSPDHHEDHRDAVVDLDVMELSSVKKIPTQSHHDNNKARVHECSICGSEFPSGQALGGHMRRHRAVIPPSTVSPGRLMSSETAATVVIDTGGPRNILSLDLNLPAPDDQDDDDDQQVCDDMSTKFVHVLPRPAPLVDCYY